MKKFWKRQCEIARTMMKSEVTDEYIQKEYNKIPVDEWDEMCIQVDTLLKKHNAHRTYDSVDELNAVWLKILTRHQKEQMSITQSEEKTKLTGIDTSGLSVGMVV